MANTIDFILTNAAAELISKVLNGKTLTFTRMAVGDGFSYDTTVAKGFKTLVNEVLNLDITKNEILTPSSVRITSAFKNTDAQKEFYYREVGLFAQDPDTGHEVLYAYGNRNDAAELITPTGSNVVTKKLIFIIAVGDSANVTFNVNADVYALQSDMLDVQENKANKDLSNTGMITNCLLEVPQNIKLELNDGVLTLKAGSVVTVPLGNGEFEHRTIDKDISTTWDYNGKGVVFYQYRNGYLYNMPEKQVTSGATVPTFTDKYCAWYDTTTQIVKITESEGENWDTGLTLPLGIINCTINGIISIDQVFNGMGHIGSTIWVDKGVKGLIPNGRNPDGTLKNINFETSSLHIRDFSTIFNNSNATVYLCFTNYHNRDVMLDYRAEQHTFFDGKQPITNDRWWFDSNSNFWFYINGVNAIPHLWLNFAKVTLTNGTITSFVSEKPFEAINRTNDKAWMSSLALPSCKYIDYTLGTNGTNYLAPANGWFAIKKVAGTATAGISFAVLDYTGTVEIYRHTIKNTVATDESAMIIPILKGQFLNVTYDVTGETKYFRFIYAGGETN